MIDSSVILKCKDGDRKAFADLYKVTSPYVFTIVKNYIHHEESRRDVMQEIYAAIFTSLERYDENKGAFKSWIAKVSINQCIYFLRQTKKLTNLFSIEESHTRDFTENDFEVLNNINREDIELILGKMPVGYRTVFLLNVIDEYDHKEIAKMLNISAETSRSQLSRSLNWIRKHIFTNIKDHKYGIEL
jgi:RNA polymerase sigma-70 factor (ECF subfamily)